jgi:hypothetical protein
VAPGPSATADVVSSAVTFDWGWPNDPARLSVVTHDYPVPPLPVLRAISVGEHNDARPAFDRISFTFTGTFPTYGAEWVSHLTADASGEPVPLDGNDVLRITFRSAEAHDASGSTVQSAPPGHVGYAAITSYAQAGDFEGIITYGVGNFRTVTDSNPQVLVRTVEVKKGDGKGGSLYVVAFDIQTRGLGGVPAEP